MAESPLPSPPSPVRSGLRPIPTFDPRTLVLGGLGWGLLLGLGLLLVRFVAGFLGIRRPALDRGTAGSSFLTGIVTTLAVDSYRKRRTTVTVRPGWIAIEEADSRTTIPRRDVDDATLERSLLDRLLGTATLVLHRGDGETVVSRVRSPDAVCSAVNDGRSV